MEELIDKLKVELIEALNLEEITPRTLTVKHLYSEMTVWALTRLTH